MKRLIKFPSIDQFRTVVKNVKWSAQYVGYDEEIKEQVFDLCAKMPVINAIASEKIHGTNGSVCYSLPDGLWVQSKENIIIPEKDNAGCAFHAMQNFEPWMEIITILAEEYNIDLWKNIITVYFEWCGSGIMKNTAVQGLDKMAMIFRYFKVSPIEPVIADDGQEKSAYWLETCYEYYGGKRRVENQEARIFNIMNFPTYEFDIDFANPLASQNNMIDIVENTIEPNSPVGQQFGMENNIGEGIVVNFVFKGQMYNFKVKGEKHSKSKVKTLKPVDDEKLQKIQDIAQQVTPAWRLEQMFTEANDLNNGGQPDVRNLGKFMKLLASDIVKEESDVIAEAGLEPKEVFKAVPNIARPWYQEQLNILIMGE